VTDSDPIPDAVRRFVLTNIASVPHLEALLLLRADVRAWSTDELARRLYTSDKNAARLLADLCHLGMAEDAGDGTVRYAPQSPATGAMLDTVARLYSQNLVAMTNLIHSSVDRKAQQFAAAFTFRKGP
jgi:hypothetical protein